MGFDRPAGNRARKLHSTVQRTCDVYVTTSMLQPPLRLPQSGSAAGSGCDLMGCRTPRALPLQAMVAPVSWAPSLCMLLCSPSALEEILAAAANGASAKGKRKKKGAARLAGKENSQEGAPWPVWPPTAPLCTPGAASLLPTDCQF